MINDKSREMYRFPIAEEICQINDIQPPSLIPPLLDFEANNGRNIHSISNQEESYWNCWKLMTSS